LKLNKPEFVLYLGRKACPIAFPVQAHIVDGETIRDAVQNNDFKSFDSGPQFKVSRSTKVVWEQCDFSGFDNQELNVVISRNDELVNRKQWHFKSRTEICGQFG